MGTGFKGKIGTGVKKGGGGEIKNRGHKNRVYKIGRGLEGRVHKHSRGGGEKEKRH